MSTAALATRTNRTSTIALKLVMAASGLIFVGYVLVHMYGNLKVFAGQAAFDEYAHHLRVLGEPMLPYGGVLWAMRIALLVAVVAHVWSAATLWRRARGARRQRYAVKKSIVATLSSRMMRWGGIALLAFVIFHLLHLTTRTVNPSGTSSDSPYVRVVEGFEIWWVALIYLVALVALGMHLRHGVYSMCQTLGWTGNPRRRRLADATGLVVAIVIAGGFALVPLAVLFGLVS
ncbi:MAG: succinate dehydrogenase cytochrome b subunit [Beutenbergiaceae bacterium]